MEQILNKLSEIELTARRIMEEADRTKTALSAETEQKCKEFDASLEKETNDKISQLRSSLDQNKDAELNTLRKKTEESLKQLDQYYEKNHARLSEELFQRLLEY